jgi:type II secretory pathway pseudopilin PulG
VQLPTRRVDAIGTGLQIRRREDGYAMAALLVAMSVMAVMMTVALPVYTTAARREKEAELIFRGEQYARAINMFQRKYGNAIPPNLDVLLNEKFLRKKYKDPITGEDFQLLSPGTPIPGQGTPPGGRGAPQGGRGAVDRAEEARRQADALRQRADAARSAAGSATPLAASVIGVVSKSTERSLRLYNGRDRYNEWVFLGTQQSNRPGGVQGGAVPGGRGGRAGPQQPAVPGARGQRLTLPEPGGRRGTAPFGPTFPNGPGGRRGAGPGGR